MNLSQEISKYITEYKRVKENIIVVDWLLGNVCNYKCSYCFTGANEGDKRVPSLDSYEKNLDYFLKKIEESNLKAYYIISGGEPTVYPHLDLILKKIKSHKTYERNLILTNGSRSLNWWEKNKNLFDIVNLSFHIETADKNHVLEVCKILKDLSITLNIIMHDTRFDDCVNAHNFFMKNNILDYANITVKALDDRSMSTLVKYNNEQNLFIKSNYLYHCTGNIEKKPSLDQTVAIDKYNIKYDFLQNAIAHIDPDFTGWECMIGSEHITIGFDGDIHANCNEKIFDKKYNLYKGDLESENFDLRKKPHVCLRGKCRCLGLYNISKKLPSNVS